MRIANKIVLLLIFISVCYSYCGLSTNGSDEKTMSKKIPATLLGLYIKANKMFSPGKIKNLNEENQLEETVKEAIPATLLIGNRKAINGARTAHRHFLDHFQDPEIKKFDCLLLSMITNGIKLINVDLEEETLRKATEHISKALREENTTRFLHFPQGESQIVTDAVTVDEEHLAHFFPDVPQKPYVTLPIQPEELAAKHEHIKYYGAKQRTPSNLGSDIHSRFSLPITDASQFCRGSSCSKNDRAKVAAYQTHLDEEGLKNLDLNHLRIQKYGSRAEQDNVQSLPAEDKEKKCIENITGSFPKASKALETIKANPLEFMTTYHLTPEQLGNVFIIAERAKCELATGQLKSANENGTDCKNKRFLESQFKRYNEKLTTKDYRNNFSTYHEEFMNVLPEKSHSKFFQEYKAIKECFFHPKNGTASKLLTDSPAQDKKTNANPKKRQQTRARYDPSYYAGLFFK
jgi:hypothetical protein